MIIKTRLGDGERHLILEILDSKGFTFEKIRSWRTVIQDIGYVEKDFHLEIMSRREKKSNIGRFLVTGIHMMRLSHHTKSFV